MGTRAGLEALFRGARGIAATERDFVFRSRSPAHFVEVFRTWHGPVPKAFAALDAAGQVALERDILELLAGCNRAEDGTLVAPAAYLEVVIRR